MRVSLKFAAVSGTTPVSCAAPIASLGTGSTTAALQDLRFYISNVRLTRMNHTSMPLILDKKAGDDLTRGGNRVSLIDLENGAGSCDQGDTRINATITSAPAPLDLAAMNWSWQSGRKFNKIEVVDPAGASGTWASKAFFVHPAAPAARAIRPPGRPSRAAARTAWRSAWPRSTRPRRRSPST